MWVRKTPEEIAQEESRAKGGRFDPKWPLLVVLVFGLVYLPFIGFRKGLGLVFFLFFVAYVLQVYFGKFIALAFFTAGTVSGSEDDPLICTVCHEPRTADQETCTCGGPLEPMRHWKWQNQPSAAGKDNATETPQ